MFDQFNPAGLNKSSQDNHSQSLPEPVAAGNKGRDENRKDEIKPQTQVEDIFAAAEKMQKPKVEKPIRGDLETGLADKLENTEVKPPTLATKLDRNETKKEPAAATSGIKDSLESDLPPGVTTLANKPKRKIGLKKIFVPIVVILLVVVLSLIARWAYGRFFSQTDNFTDNFNDLEQGSGLDDVLRDLSDDLKSADETDRTRVDTDERKEEMEPAVDTDNDGLDDKEELNLGTNPGRVDTDFDGLSDFDEVKKYKTNPVDSDSDDDNYLDGIEVQNGFNPLGPGEL